MAFQDIDDEELAELFKILGHPLRMKIVKLLADGPLSYTSLLSRLDQQSTGTLNFHLNKLKVLVEKKDEAYRLNDIGTKAVSLMVSYSQNIEETGLGFSKKKGNEFSWERLVELPIYYLPIIAIAILLINIVIQTFVEYIFTDSEFLDFIKITIHLITEVMVLVIIIEKIWKKQHYKNYIGWGLLSFTVPWYFFQIVSLGLLHDRVYLFNQWIRDIGHIDFLFVIDGFSINSAIRLVFVFILAIIIVYRKFGEFPSSTLVSSHEIVVVRSEYRNFWTDGTLIKLGLSNIILQILFLAIFRENSSGSTENALFNVSITVINLLAIVFITKLLIDRSKIKSIEFNHIAYFGILTLVEYLLLDILEFSSAYTWAFGSFILWQFPLILTKYILLSLFIRMYFSRKMKKEVQIQGNYGAYMLVFSFLVLIQLLSTEFINNFEILFFIVLGFVLMEGITFIKPRIAKIIVLSLIASAIVWIVLNNISIWLMDEFGSFIIYGIIFTILTIPLILSNYSRVNQHWILLTIMFAMLFFDSVYLIILMPFMYLYSYHKTKI